MVSFDSHLKKMSSHWDFLGPLESLGFISWCFPLRYQVCWCVDYVYTYLCSFGVVDFKLCVYRYNRYMCVYNMYMYMYMYTNISMYIYIHTVHAFLTGMFLVLLLYTQGYQHVIPHLYTQIHVCTEDFRSCV